MENEKGGFDVEEWAEEGIQASKGKIDDDFEPAPAEEEPGPTEKEPEPELEPTPKEPETKPKPEEKEPESTIDKLLKGEEQQRVPVEDHIKLRQRAQAAEKRAEEAERQLAEQDTQTGGEKPGPTDKLAELEDDDLVRAGDVRQAIKQQVGTAVSKVTKDIATERATQDARVMAQKAIDSEKPFRDATPDYDEITSAANNLDIITDADRKEIFKDPNPAQKYYEIAKARITNIQKNLGITPATTPGAPKTKTKAGEEEEETLTDDEIFDEVYT